MAGRTVIVTGAGGGVGRATAFRFAKAKDRLILTDCDAVRGRAVADEVKAAGGSATFIEAELHKKLDVHNVVADALDTYGQINVLAHCDSYFAACPLLETTMEDYETLFDRNVRAAFLINRAVAREIVKQAAETSDGGVDTAYSGAIVNVVSTEAVTAHPDHALFGATQGAIVQLTKSVALSLSPYGARANVVGVAAIKSELEDIEVQSREEKKAVLNATPLSRRGEPEEVAGSLFFLASKDASFITGQTLMVDGGQLAVH
ncbi:MAG: SDR family oxidoreductase [Pseudomonadota bacterium]